MYPLQHFRTVVEADGTTQLVMTERAKQAVLTQHREASMRQSVKDILDDEFLDYSTQRDEFAAREGLNQRMSALHQSLRLPQFTETSESPLRERTSKGYLNRQIEWKTNGRYRYH